MLHALLCLSPALVLAIPLLAKRYPGERVLLARCRTMPNRWARPRSSSTRLGRRVVLQVVRGGRLIASSLAERPPPALALTS
ncbi:MAG TPA: hypothetical protein VGG08_01960 [Solirubrobacteraceae bacterium]